MRNPPDRVRSLYLAKARINNAIYNASKKLNLSHLDLGTVPERVWTLKHLEVLQLARCNLEVLSEDVGNLNSLKTLHLFGNHLRTLPAGVGKLTLLQCLYLGSNQLHSLPDSLRNLVHLDTLDLSHNDLLGISGEDIVSEYRSPGKVLAYYFRTRSLDKRFLNEAKLIFVGRGGVGKTSLRKILLKGYFNSEEDKTPGIVITPWHLTLSNDLVRLNVWDFGGQEIMHATHQFFLTKRSLYLLVLNAREGEQDANIEYWLRLIAGFGGGSPTLVIINKCDQHPLDLDERGLRGKFPFIRSFLRTDCATKFGIGELRAAIAREADLLPGLRAPFPTGWFRLKDELGTMKEDCITYDAYSQLCAGHPDAADAEAQRLLIGYLHDLGIVLHFQDEVRLRDLGVLKPEWATQGIYRLLNADKLKAAGGVLRVEQMGELLDTRRYPPERHDFLLELMRKFELCFELPDTGGQRFLIPELLPKETPDLATWEMGADQQLGFEYEYNVLPEGLLPRFIVRTHGLSEPTGCLRWRGGVTLEREGVQALVRADVQERRVWITLRGPGRKPRELLAVIRREFEIIHGGIKGLIAQEKVPVPGYPEVKLDYRRLLVREANKKEMVEFETETESLERPLGRLLDNFEDRPSRQERLTINVGEGGKLFMPKEHYDFSGAHITNSVVGAHMTNVTNAIQQLPLERTELREALEALKQHAEPLLIELPEDSMEAAAQYLEEFTMEAVKDKPRKPFLEMTSKGLIDAAKTVAKMAPSIIESVGLLKGLLGY